MLVDTLLKRATRMATLDMQRSGYFPSSADVLCIQSITSEMESELPRIDAEIARLRKLRVRVSQQCALQKSIVSPIRRLPPETLSEIFIALFDCRRWASDGVFIVRYTLSCVCTSWRAVARGTPALWNRIPSRLHSPSPRSGWMLSQWKDYAAHAPQHLALAGGLPLEIQHRRPHARHVLETLFVKLGDHFQRVRSIELQCRFKDLKPLRAIRLPELRMARIELHGRPSTCPLEFLRNSPLLNDLTIEYIDNDDEPHYYALHTIPFPAIRTLTRLSIEIDATFPHTELRQVLLTCASSLEDLSLLLEGDTPPTVPISAPVQMDALQCIRLAGTAYHVLNYVAAPIVREIAVYAVSVPIEGDPFPLLQEFVTRPPEPAKPTSLTTSVTTYDTASFLRCLENMPSIQELRVDDIHCIGLFTEDVFARLTCSDDKPALLPRLTTFRTTLCPPSRRTSAMNKALKAMDEMVASRKIPRTCVSQEIMALEVVDIDLPDVDDEQAEGYVDSEGYESL